MTRHYTAKTPHKRPCDLCGVEIVPGDRVAMWCYVGEDGPESSDIMRVHETCERISVRELFDRWIKGWAFQEDSGYGWPKDRDESAPLQVEAREALAEARRSASTSEVTP